MTKSKILSDEQQQTALRQGEYCGNCGHVPETEAEYNRMKKCAWYCNKKCEMEATIGA